MPLQIGLLVHLHDHFASKYLIDAMHYINLDALYQLKQQDVNITPSQKF